MRIFLTVIAALVFVLGTFGQEVVKDSNAKTPSYEDIYREFKELVKDSQSDFASIRGSKLSQNSSEIEYAVTKRYFQSAGFTSVLIYYGSEMKYELAFYTNQSGNPAQKQTTNALIELFKYYLLKEVGSMSDANYGDYAALYDGKIISMLDAKLTSSGNFKAMRFFSNPAAWTSINNKLSSVDTGMLSLIVVDRSVGLDKAIGETNKVLDDSKKTPVRANTSSNYTNLLNQCEEDLKKEDHAKTVEDCSEAIKLDPNDARTRHARGTAYYFLPDKPMTAQERLLNSPNKNKRLAIADLELATKLDPKNADYFFALGMAQLGALESDKMDAAAKSFTEVLRLNSSDPDAYLYRAEANRIYNNPSESLEDSIKKTHRSRDRKRSAISDYTTYLQSNANNANALMGRGLVYIELGLYDGHNYELGIADLTKVIDQGKNIEKIYLARGTAYIETGKFSLALDDLNKALKLHDSVKQPQLDPKRNEILSEIERAKRAGK